MKLDAAAPPNVTAVAPVNAVPVIVTVVPPAVGPEVGEIAVIAGADVAMVEARAVAGSKPPPTIASTMLANRNRFAGNVTWPNARVTIAEITAAPSMLVLRYLAT